MKLKYLTDGCICCTYNMMCVDLLSIESVNGRIVAALAALAEVEVVVTMVSEDISSFSE